MAKSLQEQLIEAGLASAGQAKKAGKEKRAAEQRARTGGKRKKRRGDGAPEVKQPGTPAAPASQGGAAAPGANEAELSAAQRARRAQARKVRRDQELARARNEKARARAERAEIKQLLAQHDQRVREASDTDVVFSFVHGKKIKRLHLPPAQRDQLSSGELIIVNNDGLYHLVRPDIAKRIADRDPKWIISLSGDTEPAADSELDDYYKKFEVPDDLDW